MSTEYGRIFIKTKTNNKNAPETLYSGKGTVYTIFKPT
jgi:hypothetical protein